MIQLLLKRYFALPRNIKIAILVTIFLSIISLIIWGIYGIVLLFRPNPNGWEKVSKLGISMPLKYEVHGIDVSHHNGEINWKKVKKMRFEENLKIEFAFLKATEGITHADRQFERNWEHARKLGMKRGAYHFYIAWREPVGQARNFINSVKLEKGDFVPVLDIEQNSLKPDEQIIREIGVWLEMVENHYGAKPIIYTNPNFYKKFIKGNFDEYPLWIADYSKESLKGYGSKLWFWQHNKNGWVEGIKGTVDFNVFLGNKAELEGLCIQ